MLVFFLTILDFELIQSHLFTLAYFERVFNHIYLCLAAEQKRRVGSRGGSSGGRGRGSSPPNDVGTVEPHEPPP
jgi:hypothetical protein